MTTQQIKTELNGCEVTSLNYEGTVYVKNGEAYRDGEKIKVSWKKLWKEYVGNEVGDEMRELTGY